MLVFAFCTTKENHHLEHLYSLIHSHLNYLLKVCALQALFKVLGMVNKEDKAPALPEPTVQCECLGGEAVTINKQITSA